MKDIEVVGSTISLSGQTKRSTFSKMIAPLPQTHLHENIPAPDVMDIERNLFLKTPLKKQSALK